MIECVGLYKQHIIDFYSVFNFNFKFSYNTLMLDEDITATSILRMIAKIDLITKGEIFIDGKNIKTISDKDLNLAYLPEKPILFENKNVYKNLIYPLNLRKYDKNKAKNMVNDMISQLNLQNFKKSVKNLVTSKKKILSLARASLWEPKYLMLENFFEGLTPDDCSTAQNIINNLPNSTIIIACEKENVSLPIFKDFNIIKFENGTMLN